MCVHVRVYHAPGPSGWHLCWIPLGGFLSPGQSSRPSTTSQSKAELWEIEPLAQLLSE